MKQEKQRFAQWKKPSSKERNQWRHLCLREEEAESSVTGIRLETCYTNTLNK
jgi:hypothetical protein